MCQSVLVSCSRRDSQCSVECNAPLEGGTFLGGKPAALPSRLSCARNLHPSPSWNKKKKKIARSITPFPLNIPSKSIVFIFPFSSPMIDKMTQPLTSLHSCFLWVCQQWRGLLFFFLAVLILNVFTATGSAGMLLFLKPNWP